MATRSRPSFGLILVSTVVLGACGAAGGGGSGSGGATGATGGAGIGSGGASTGSGGGVGSGGAQGGTGGTTGSGGAPRTGGSGPGSGGSAAGSGGRNGGGGRANTGGTPASGGAGGSATGSGGASSGNGGAGTMSAGCGKAAPAGGRLTIDVGGMTREYILFVPTGYDPMKPYRLIFTWHPLGGSAMQVAGSGNNGYYGLRAASNGAAILVSPEGLPFQGGSLGWANTNGRDIDFLKAMIARFKDEMCIDETRMFSTGFSFGGMMSNAVGCAGLARAVAPMAGNTQVSGCQSGTMPVAYMGFHGTHDSVVDISGGQAARDVFVKRNKCSATTAPTTPSWCDGLAQNYMPCNCVTYQDCTPGYPVTWCEYNADHQAAPTSAATLWTFFSQF